MKTTKLIVTAMLAAGLCAGQARAIDSASNGYWDVGAMWSGGVVPTNTDDVTIMNTHTVTVRDVVTHYVSNLTIQAGSVLTHLANNTTEAYKCIVDVSGNLTIDAGGAIDVDGKGYAATYGPGARVSGYGGGGHGGIGGYLRNYDGTLQGIPGYTCGSITAPTNCGSGGNSGPGGGAVTLTVRGDTVLNGNILARGTLTSYQGSGGSVFLTTRTLDGSGTIDAGVVGGGSCNAPGGGGRVAVVLTNENSVGSVNLRAASRATTHERGYNGSAGTIYTRTRDQAPDSGTLLVNAYGVVPSGIVLTELSSTLIRPEVTDAAVGTVIVTNQALLVVSNDTLTIRGNLENKATVRGLNGSTFLFAGTNEARINGNILYYNLTCTNAGKTLKFEDGKTNTVDGKLTLTGPTLDSVSGVSAWRLKVAPPPATHSVSNVKVGQSDANPGATIEAYDSTDQGGNSNWVFAASGLATNIWTGATDSDWSRTNNWSLNRTTIYTDNVLIPGSCLNYPVLNFHKRLLSLTIASNATMRLNGYDLTVDQTISVTGTLIAAGAATLTIGGNLDFTGGGIFNAASSTVRIVGSNAQTVVSAGNAFYNLTISNSAAPVVFADAVVASNIVNQATPVTFAGPVTVVSAFRTQGTNVTFCGAVTAPTFFNANGALVFSGTVATVTFTNWAGDLTFRDDFSTREFYGAPGGMAFTFKDGKTYTVGNWEVYGRNGYPIVLQSSSPGSDWNLNVTNWSKVRQVDVKDSDASAGQTIRPVASANSGNNTNWVFDPTWQTWIGSVSPVFTNGDNWAPVGVPTADSRLLIDGYYVKAPELSGVATAAQVIVGGVTTATLTVNGRLAVREAVEILPNGTITHSPNSGSAETNRMYLTVAQDLIIHCDGAIDVDGMGYAPSQGPGAAGSYGGGGHGGMGGWHNSWPTHFGTTYGSITAPINCGSGGGATSGGGAAILNVKGETRLEGRISARGAGGAMYQGAGGSVFLTTGALAGSGIIDAGSFGGTVWASGGGGRIAVILTNGADFGSVRMQAFSASGSHNNGAAGTVYRQTKDQAPGMGTLLVDANGIVSGTLSSTLIWTNVTGTTVGTVIVTNAAKLAISNQTLTVQGDWINKTTFIAQTNSTVDFAGGNAATIYTNNTFFNFTCTNAGKTLVFEAGKTNTVTGLLKLGASQAGQMVTLQSTVGGSWSYLTLPPGGMQQIARVNVKDNNAGGGQTLLAGGGSANGGNNINWQFPPSGTMFMVK